ncbi:MAG: bifunctional DNA-binding transcriptional regulator/O6-methylguanine-DNA methyltransferase Ada [Hyphomicrobiales bacterium]|nr:bifunctional DNA-binding transcriptional regulator/O6-methylguanine-DNA methyltransferase Ada [Hyphomicrobiales bacterium]MCY4033699.1 bifunctional DNA-binding transcriptional regulator/O6-methylguanine-DNA methyltransferase Ada [Hyphomicrobiales bacterium]
MSKHSDTKKWNAVQTRDSSCSGAFVFAVRTTGIYCRPGCRARTPKRENTLFYDTPAQAEVGGYRACKRCRPDKDDAAPHLKAVVRACRTLRSAEEEPDLSSLAADAGLSAGHFQRIFKEHIGLSPKQYARAARKQKLRESLNKAESVTEAIFAAGYNSTSRAYADDVASGARMQLLRRGAKGETIQYASAKTSLGDIIVATTERGVCFAEFLDDRKPEDALRKRFAFAQIKPAPKTSTQWLRKVVERVDDPARGGDIPLDIRGTAFQEKVWNALIDIPVGETRSYGELAHDIGHPKAARAIGAACNANPVAVVVPCHRVVGANKSLTGYRWGLKRKQKLLQRETQCSESKRPKPSGRKSQPAARIERQNIT